MAELGNCPPDSQVRRAARQRVAREGGVNQRLGILRRGHARCASVLNGWAGLLRGVADWAEAPLSLRVARRHAERSILSAVGENGREHEERRKEEAVGPTSWKGKIVLHMAFNSGWMQNQDVNLK
jgi:hypothetical protein